MEYFTCPHCGADVPTTAKFCRECGADESSGWGDNDVDYSAEDDFDYDDFVRREFPDHTETSARQFSWIQIVVILLILSMLFTLVF